MYHDRETRVMVNQSVNVFYTPFLCKVDALRQGVAFPLEVAATFFDKLIPGVRVLLVSEGLQVPPISPTETNC